MTTSRRKFLKQGTLVAIAAGMPLSLVQKVVGRSAQVHQSAGLGLTKAAFAAQLNSQFRINERATKVLVKLVGVNDLPRRGAIDPRKEGFSLVFRGSHSSALKQNTYLIEHQTLGAFSFLIVPVMSKDKSAMYYEAIVNRLFP